jgi:hypothetical protein
MNERVCKCVQPENSIRHSSATAKSVDAHQFMPSQPISPESKAPEPRDEDVFDRIGKKFARAVMGKHLDVEEALFEDALRQAWKDAHPEAEAEAGAGAALSSPSPAKDKS